MVMTARKCALITRNASNNHFRRVDQQFMFIKVGSLLNPVHTVINQ